MKSLRDLKEKLSYDEELRKKFSGISSEEQALKLANDLGYDITSNDLENDDELRDDMLEVVAGGKGKATIVNVSDIAGGKGSVIINKDEIQGEWELEGNKGVKSKVKWRCRI